MSAPFERHPVTARALRERGDEVRHSVTPAMVRHEAIEWLHGFADAATGGTLSGPIADAFPPVSQGVVDVIERGLFASGVVERWADAVEVFDQGIHDLNMRWKEAATPPSGPLEWVPFFGEPAEPGPPPGADKVLASLAHERDLLEHSLYEAGNRCAKLLDAGPTAVGVADLWAGHDLPPYAADVFERFELTEVVLELDAEQARTDAALLGGLLVPGADPDPAAVREALDRMERLNERGAALQSEGAALTSAEIDYLSTLWEGLGPLGVDLDEPELATSLLLLSADGLGGGWGSVPESVQASIEHGLSGRWSEGTDIQFHELSSFFVSADSDVHAGPELSDLFLRSAVEIADDRENVYPESDLQDAREVNPYPFQEEFRTGEVRPFDELHPRPDDMFAEDLLSVGARNHDASVEALTDRDFARDLFTLDWNDGGTAAGQAVMQLATPDIGSETLSEDARRGYYEVLDTITNTDGGTFREVAENVSDHAGLSNAFAYATQPHIDHFGRAFGHDGQSAWMPQDRDFVLNGEDAGRALMLSQYEQHGRDVITAAVELRRLEVLSADNLSVGDAEELARLDAKVAAGAENAIAHAHDFDAERVNAELMESHERKHAVIDVVQSAASVVGPVPYLGPAAAVGSLAAEVYQQLDTPPDPVVAAHTPSAYELGQAPLDQDAGAQRWATMDLVRNLLLNGEEVPPHLAYQHEGGETVRDGDGEPVLFNPFDGGADADLQRRELDGYLRGLGYGEYIDNYTAEAQHHYDQTNIARQGRDDFDTYLDGQ